MAINFNDYLTTEQQRELISQRISQLAVEAYSHKLNVELGEVLNDETTINEANNALTVLSKAIEHLQTLGESDGVS